MPSIPNYFRLQAKLRKVSRIALPQTKWLGPWNRLKFVARGLLYGPWMEPWLAFLESGRMQTIARLYPRLYLKIQWPYLNRNYQAVKRLELVRHHYQFALSHFSEELLNQLFSTPFVPLARWNVPELGVFTLRLSHENKFSQEGEMVLGLYQEESSRLCALFCFSITAQSEISIGCVQGGKPVAGLEEISNKDLIVTLTRRMHGLRPKNLLLFALRQLAAHWSIANLRAVSTQAHIWEKSLQSDYSNFWEEMEGTLRSDGMYELSSSSEFKDLQDVKPKKRAMYRHRYQFLQQLGREIEARLEAPDRRPALLGASAAQEQLTNAELP